MMLAADITGSPFQNQTDPYDVTNNGNVSAFDALMVITALNAGGSGPLELAEGENDSVTTAQSSSTHYIDVNGDEFLDSRDALNVIQKLNGESEPGDVVTFRLEITDLAGSPISEVPLGNEFAASSTGVPGRVEDDAADLYRVMELAYERVKERIDVSEFYLTGYSLGGWQAAFVARLDEEAQVFDFAKVLMINPPVSLYSSIRILDHMLIDNVPGGTDGLDDYFERIFNAFIQVYKDHEFTNFGEDFLYRAYTTYEPDEEGLAALIGLSFRLSSNNMVFTSDVMSQSGYVVPKSLELTNSSSLTEYFKVGIRFSFEDYLDELFYPYFKAKDPSLTREDLIEEASLERIEDYLVRSPKIGLMTNEDDVILAPGEIDYLREVFGERAQIFPTGGHCGNLAQRHVIAYMTGFFKG